MHIDWTMPIGTLILLGVQFLGFIMAGFAFFRKVERAFDEKFHEIKSALQKLAVGDVAQLALDVTRIDTEQRALKKDHESWIEIFRERWHKADNKLNVLNLKVDRLERPGHYGFHRDPPSTEDTNG